MWRTRLYTREPTADEAEAIAQFHSSGAYEDFDNERVATIGNWQEQELFEEVEEHGCCGSEDVVLVTKTGVAFRYGFNWGH